MTDHLQGPPDDPAHGSGAAPWAAPGDPLPAADPWAPGSGPPPAPVPPEAQATDLVPTPTPDDEVRSWPLPDARSPGGAAPADPLGPPPPTDPLGPPALPGGSDWAGPPTPAAPAPVLPYGGPPGTPSAPARAGRSLRPRAWLAVALVSALVGGAVGAVVVALAGNNGTSGPSLTVREGNAVPGAAQLAGNVTIPQLVHQVLPAVVSIDVKAGGQEDQGTGMILSPDGSVVTNYHVVALSAAEGGTITVTRSGQVKAQPATLVGTDPANDVALLHVTGASGLPTVVFGNSTRAGVGDAVVAIGNALGLAAGTPTVTSGIISAKGRTVQAADSTGSGAETLTDMLQTDAAINPGNSGGPLIDTEGQVIGMNTAVAGTTSDGTSAQNIGFAIPSARIESLLPELERGGVSRGGGYLGVDVTTLTPALRQQYGFTPKTGAVVLDVASGSPAETAGLQSGDVITEVNGTTVTNADQLQNAVQKAKANEHIELTYYQGANKKTVGVTLGSQALAQQQQQQQQAQSGGFGSIPGFGGASPFG